MAKVGKTQLEFGENSSSQVLSCSPQHFKSPKTLLELCTTVKEMSPSLIEMDFFPAVLFPHTYRSADSLFSCGDAGSDKTEQKGTETHEWPRADH